MSSLRNVYNDYVRLTYHVSCWGDSNPHETEVIEAKVQRLGLNNDEFVVIACTLWEEYAQRQGMAYPIWNLIKSEATFKRIGKLLQVIEPTLQADNYAVYEFEMLYAQQYLDWLAGTAPKPIHNLDVPNEVRLTVARQICQQHQVQFISSNYNNIYRQIHDNRS